MIPEATSRHLKQVTELTLLAPIVQGFVPVPDVLSYASRLRLVLRALFELRRVAIERDLVETAGPLERLRSLYDVRWAIVDDDRKLLLAVTFDRSWESYIQGIVDEAAPLLDLIFSHCEGYEGHRCEDGYAAFASWVRARQTQCEFFYAGLPDVTVDDARYLRGLALSGEHAPLDEKLVEGGTADSGYRVLAALYDLKRWFPKGDALRWNALARVTIPRLDTLSPDAGPLDPDHAQWLVELKTPAPAGRAYERKPPPHYDALRDVVQANILTYREGMTHGLVALVRCHDPEAMRDWLQRVGPRVSAESSAREADVINLGFTYAGLRHFASRAELQELPKEFRQGMEARAGLLGDTGAINSPEQWMRPIRNWPAPMDPDVTERDSTALGSVDAVLIVQGRRAGVAGDHLWSGRHPLHDVLAELVHGARVEVLHVQALRREVEREHFGFTDNISQPAPVIAGLEVAAPSRDRVALGEIVLGYENARGFTERWPAAASGEDNLFTDGTFLVFRKLEQDVAAYRTFVAQRPQLDSGILGRDIETGDPLVGPDGRSNDFDYGDDRSGARCPLFAHVRRANPRPRDPQLRERTPRILRRSFTYGSRYEDEPERDRGLFFMAYNASIAQQYEVVQRWINGGNSSGALSGQTDLFCGTLPPKSGPYFVGDARIQPPERQLVNLRWGLYLFVPSLRVLERWSRPPVALNGPDAQQVARGEHIVAALRAVGNDPEVDALRAWKRVLEDLGTVEERAALWAYVREDPEIGGVLDTPYGVLVASAGHAQTVLTDSGKIYSVCKYGERMQSSLGLKQHLGLDVHVPQYALQAQAPNAFAASIGEDAAFEQTRELSRQFLAGSGDVHVEGYASQLLVRLAHAWFGIPIDREAVQQLLITSKFVFQPHPEGHLAELADDAGPQLLAKFVAHATHPSPPAGSFLAKLQASTPNLAIHGEAVLSLVSGFYAATFGSFIAAIDGWIESGELWRLAPDREVLRPALLATLRRRQGPTVIYRTAQVATELNGVAIEAGKRVVVGIGSAANDDPSSQFDWLFGGAYTPGRGTQHACPAQPMALGVMLGLAAALLEQKELTRVRRFLLRYAR